MNALDIDATLGKASSFWMKKKTYRPPSGRCDHADENSININLGSGPAAFLDLSASNLPSRYKESQLYILERCIPNL